MNRMTEETIVLTTISMKIDALEAVLNIQQLEEYRKILKVKKNNFITVWSKYLSKEKLQEALASFEV